MTERTGLDAEAAPSVPAAAVAAAGTRPVFLPNEVDPTVFDPPSGTFLVLVDGDEVLAGGGLRRFADGVCEVKRMWTAPGHRRKGYAALVLTKLEDAARAAGYSSLLLETGPRQPEAIAFYTVRGYTRIPYYGHYDQALAFHLDLDA